MAISVLALLITFTGVASALPGKNAVNSGDVKKDTLTGKDIKESTLVLPAAAIAEGLKVTVQTKFLDPAPPIANSGGTVACPGGKRPIAGGGYSDQTSLQSPLVWSFPASTTLADPPQSGESFASWGLVAVNGEIDRNTVPVVYVVCVG